MPSITTSQIGDIIIALKSKAEDYARMAVIAPEYREFWEKKKAEALGIADQLRGIRDKVYFSKDLRTRVTVKF